MSEPLISVVMPFYNAADWLLPALKSLDKQEISYELIAVDDGSTDCGAEYVEAYARKNSSVKLIQFEKNRGIVDSLNHGISLAEGEYIARMDADDICFPNRFLKQLNFIKERDVDLCGTWCVQFGQGLSRITRWPAKEGELRAAMMFQNSICHPTVMAKRKVYEKIKYRSEYTLVEDYDCFVRAMAEFRIANMPEPLLYYRRHRAQATQAKRDKMEGVNRLVRIQALESQGVFPSEAQARYHHLIRSPSSILDEDDLKGIEDWLSFLCQKFSDLEMQRAIASQWVRACVRAAPLGRSMWKLFRNSDLYEIARVNQKVALDIYALALLKLDYQSYGFRVLQRLGLSA